MKIDLKRLLRLLTTSDFGLKVKLLENVPVESVSCKLLCDDLIEIPVVFGVICYIKTKNNSLDFVCETNFLEFLIQLRCNVEFKRFTFGWE